ncbi:ATP synthase assembly factor FMC1 [Lachancea thermotolerans]|uniref:KLTH0G10164p n=1 Tax=Lachancea thermotolerans (strain ATCC 56472 / CBS 6340 / NRRL Y-8284) TaxID=559295 RepID=C5DMM7_LACTC|nr:KLTH0G10164p [Lachancea thermotolerans CBS 6340]CAR25038.1 KLTH0G10164p [Lachancea thermotolerans CBS 6340]
MASKVELLSSYKQLVRALVKSNRRSKIVQQLEDNKKQIALLTYRKISLIRQCQDPDPQEKLKAMMNLNGLNKKIDNLKQDDPSKSRKLYFYDKSNELKKLIMEDRSAETSTIIKKLEHLRDIAGFLQNQMEFEQLVERYNPGLKMDQEEKVKRTAAKVGLQVPDI